MSMYHSQQQTIFAYPVITGYNNAIYRSAIVIQIPSEYVEGYEKARALDPELADKYIEHLNIGDPAADVVVADLASFSRPEAARLIAAAMEQDWDALGDAPESLITFFKRQQNAPEWYSPDAALPGRALFYRWPYVFTASLVGAGLVEGFSSGIARSFLYTGRLHAGSQGVRRLRQNNRHQMEVFIPGGLDRDAEGWKLSVRVRLIHAQIRRLVSAEPDWETEAWGMPISAGHLALANTVFSARTLIHVENLMRVRISKEERESFMLIWRYTGLLMGVPEALLCTTEEEAQHLFRIGLMCEPPPPMESVAMAHALIRAAPVLASMEGNASEKLVTRIFRLSRALIGDEMADALQYPKLYTRGALYLFSLETKIKSLMDRLFKSRAGGNFELMTQISNYEHQGISYFMPDKPHAERSKEW